MKNSILIVSAVLVGLATTLGIMTTILANNEASAIRAFTVAGILGLGSIGLFFVGLALPRDASVNAYLNSEVNKAVNQ